MLFRKGGGVGLITAKVEPAADIEAAKVEPAVVPGAVAKTEQTNRHTVSDGWGAVQAPSVELEDLEAQEESEEPKPPSPSIASCTSATASPRQRS